jgi:hypothetical protein
LQHIDESKKEQFLKVIADTQIILDEPIYDDSINGTIIRAIYTLIARSQRYADHREDKEFTHHNMRSLQY